MPIRGETIGTAYVRILADGSGLDDSVKREMRDVSPTMREEGEKGGTEYVKGFNDAIEANESDSDSIQRTLAQSVRRGKGIFDAGHGIGDELLEGVRDQLEKDHGNVGLIIFRDLQNALDSGQLNYSGLTRRLEDIRPLVARATEQIATDQEKTLNKMLADQAKRMTQIDKEYVDTSVNLFKARQKIVRETMADEESRIALIVQQAKDAAKVAKDAEKAGDDLQREIRATIGATDQIVKAAEKELERRSKTIDEVNFHAEHIRTQMLLDMEKAATKANAIAEREAEKERKILRERGGEWDQFADKVSQGFGRGARNDVINFFGGAIRGVLRIGDIIGKPAQLLGQFVGTLGGLAKAGDWGSFVGVLGKGAAGAVIAIGGLTIALGTMVSMLSLAAGWVVALASSLGFALVGALGVAAGAMVPLVVGLGISILAFKNMDKEAKAAFKGVKESFKGLGDIAADEMFKDAAESAETLERVIQRLGAPTRKLAGGMHDVFAGWIEGMDSPQFRNFATFVGNTMPDMMRSLGQITGNLAGVFANVWRAATPFVQEFLGWLSGVTEEWQRMTSGFTGQERLTGFFTNMRSSLISVSGFLGSVADLLGTIMSAGRATGDSIFDTMAANVDEWTAALERNPGILETWFENAEKFGESVGNLIVQIGKLIDELDNPEFREFATNIIDVLGSAVQGFGGLLRPVVALLAQMDDGLVQLIFTFGAAYLAFTKFNAGLLVAQGNLSKMGVTAGVTKGKMTGLGGSVSTLAGGLGLGLLVDSSQRAAGGLSTLESGLGGAAAGLAVGGPLGAAVGGAIGLFMGLERWSAKGGEAVESSAAQAEKAVVPWEDLTNTLNTYNGAVTESTRATIADKIIKEGNVEAYRAMGVTINDLVSAELGHVGAQQRVNAAMENERANVRVHRQELLDMIATRNKAATDVQNYTGAEIVAMDENIRKKQEQLAEEEKLIIAYDRQRQAVSQATLAERQRLALSINWRAAIKGIPTKAITYLELNGVPKNLSMLGRYADRLNLTPKQIRSMVNVLFPNAGPKKVEALIKRLKDTGALKVNPKVTVDTQDIDTRVEGIKQGLTDVNKKDTKAHVKDGTKPAKDALDTLKTKLTTIGQMTPTPKISADASDAVTDMDTVETGMNDLDGKVATTYIRTVHTTETRGPRGPASAAGGIFYGAQNRLIGEAGAEAIVPLNRALSQVDPAVRALSAFAQGLPAPNAAVGGVSLRPVELTIITPTKDPYAVAKETINQLVGAGY